VCHSAAKVHASWKIPYKTQLYNKIHPE